MMMMMMMMIIIIIIMPRILRRHRYQDVVERRVIPKRCFDSFYAQTSV